MLHEPTSLWQRRLWTTRVVAIPTLMAVIALIHVVRFCSLDQSSWGAGCGFGMFATVDAHGTRFFRCQIITHQETLPAHFGSRCFEQSLKCRIVPSQANVTELARQLIAQDWLVITLAPKDPNSTEIQRIAVCDPPRFLADQPSFQCLSSEPIRVAELRLELRGLRLDQCRQMVYSFPKRVAHHASPGMSVEGNRP